MKICVLIFLMVIQAIASEKAISKLRKKLLLPKMNEKCKKIKCPSVEEPQCVKMRREDLGITLHVIAANKCELDYIKCHDDVEAKVVPMKYCGHNTVQTTGNKNNKTGKPHIRVKRSVDSASKEGSQRGESKKVKGKPKKKNLLEMKRARIHSKKLALLKKNNKVSNVITKYSVLNDVRLRKKKGKKNVRPPVQYSFSTETDSDLERNDVKEAKEGVPGYRLSYDDEETFPFERKAFMSINGRGNRPLKVFEIKPENSDDEQEEQKRLWFQGIEMVSEEEDNGGIKMNDVDKEEYEDECPEVCPSRNVMVCAKCQHGIYKTFMSTCHMRMFTCQNHDEKLELVSRFPCIQSAPYLADDGMKPKGWIAEAEDDDTIQRYLICKATGGFRMKGNKTVCDTSVPKEPPQNYEKGDRYFYFPGDGDDILHLVDTEEPVDHQFIAEYTKNPDNNKYWLYTRHNPTLAQIIGFGDKISLANSNFNFSKTTVFQAHGWRGDAKTKMNKLLTEVFLENDDVNVIVLDWSRLAKKGYVTARIGTPAVGRGLGQFVNWLVSLGASYDRIHLVGHSLGGHLVGNAGRETGGSVRRVTAMDPAGPLWYTRSERVVSTDGKYVEVIHTNIGGFGYSDPCGDADFYPNGGKGMPGCFLKTCDHSRSYEYMAATVKYNHLLANKCGNLREATRNRCTGDLYPMGNSDLTKSRSGIFRVNTGKKFPF